MQNEKKSSGGARVLTLFDETIDSNQ